MNAMRMVLKSCQPTNISATIGTTVALGTALNPTSSG